ncbi:MAG: c-type cytochrome domain-containing protein [Planctomycetota bacterium]|nr:c-type cytochrome domain-containing protein [Planctomycetota bacterium]MEE2989272.1 c-type cytochrome domain-containing protein [Planctomycetota bacterium]
MKQFMICAVSVAGLLIAFSLSGQEKPEADSEGATPTYNEDVLPLLRKYCVGCHNPDDQEGGLDLSTFSSLMRGGTKGSVVTAGHAGLSRLVRVLDGRSRPSMPPEENEAPSAEEIGVIQKWIEGGARAPDGTAPAVTLVTPSIQPSGEVRQPISSMAILPRDKGRSLVAVARSQGVTLKSLDGRKKARQFQPDEGVINSVCFSSDGRLLVTGGGETGLFGEAIVWDPQSGRKKATLRGHQDSLFGVALDPSGRLLATAGYDRMLVIWDLEKGEPIHQIKGHNGSIHDLAFHPGGKMVATASDDRTVKLWDVASGERLDTLNQSLKELYCLAISPDGKMLAAGGVDHRIRVWRLGEDGKGTTHPLVYSVFAHQAAILKLAYSLDGTVLVSSAEDSQVKTWNAGTMTLRRTLPRQSDWVTAIATGADGELLLGQLDGAIVTASTMGAASGGKDRQSFSEPLGLVSYGPQPAMDAIEKTDEQEPNDDPARATRLELPAVARGKVFTEGKEATDVDLYRFSASKGDQWVIETRAARDKSELDSKLEILFADGRPVPRLLLRAVRDSEVEFRPISSDQRGARLKNYEEMLLNEYVFINGEVIKHFRQRRGPDSESLFYPEDGNRHTFFDTTARSHQLGQLCYVVTPFPLGTILPDNGLPVFTVNYENDDDGQRTLGRDSRITFIAPGDGDYLVRVKDVRGFDGEKFDYQLIVRRPHPDFSISVQGMNPQVNAGNGKSFSVKAVRSDGFNGPIQVDIESLPPGFQVTTPLVIQAGHQIARGVIHAPPGTPEPDASNWGTSKLTATAMVAGTEVVKPAGTLGTIKLAARAKLIVHMTPDDDSPLPVAAFSQVVSRGWTVLAPQSATTSHEDTSLGMLPDQSLLAGGVNHETETYVVTTRTATRGIRSLRLEALGDASLPTGAPGRFPDNGNFVISEISVAAAPGDGTAEAIPVAIDRVRADYSQEGWNVAGIIDNDEKTGWAVARKGEGEKYSVVKNGDDPSHWVELDFTEPVDLAGGVELTVTIKCTSAVKHHNLGHFRLAYTTEAVTTPKREVIEPLEVTIVAGKMVECRLSVERFGFADRISFEVENLPHGVIVNDIGLSGVLIPENQKQRTIFLAAEPWVPATRRLFHAVAKVEGNQVSLPMILNVVRPKQDK